MSIVSVPSPLPLCFIAPCLPTAAQKPPIGSQWVHEIKHDGYRLMARRQGGRIRLFTRHGYDWSKRYPRIVEALASLRVQSIIIDGEAVWCGRDGRTDFAKLHSHAFDDEVILYGFDLLELNGEDYRQHPLEKRKAKLEKILAWTQEIRFSDHFEGDGEIIFSHACRMGLEP
jgi:bifunctional non-homologous end joining protein LigD